MFRKLSEIYQTRIKPRAKKILFGLVILFAVFNLAGFVVLPPILKSVPTKQLSENLHREVSIDRVKINPYTLSLLVRGPTVKDKGNSETFVPCREIFLNFQSTSVLRIALYSFTSRSRMVT
jgi:hypothetical protein